MKTAVLFLALGTIPNVAFGQTDCRSIPNASDRLACYDKASPPIATPKTSTGKFAPSERPPDQGQVVDLLAAENSLLDAKLKRICRGC